MATSDKRCYFVLFRRISPFFDCKHVTIFADGTDIGVNFIANTSTPLDQTQADQVFAEIAEPLLANPDLEIAIIGGAARVQNPNFELSRNLLTF